MVTTRPLRPSTVSNSPRSVVESLSRPVRTTSTGRRNRPPLGQRQTQEQHSSTLSTTSSTTTRPQLRTTTRTLSSTTLPSTTPPTRTTSNSPKSPSSPSPPSLQQLSSATSPAVRSFSRLPPSFFVPRADLSFPRLPTDGLLTPTASLSYHHAVFPCPALPATLHPPLDRDTRSLNFRTAKLTYDPARRNARIVAGEKEREREREAARGREEGEGGEKEGEKRETELEKEEVGENRGVKRKWVEPRMHEFMGLRAFDPPEKVLERLAARATVRCSLPLVLLPLFGGVSADSSSGNTNRLTGRSGTRSRKRTLSSHSFFPLSLADPSFPALQRDPDQLHVLVSLPRCVSSPLSPLTPANGVPALQATLFALLPPDNFSRFRSLVVSPCCFSRLQAVVLVSSSRSQRGPRRERMHAISLKSTIASTISQPFLFSHRTTQPHNYNGR